MNKYKPLTEVGNIVADNIRRTLLLDDFLGATSSFKGPHFDCIINPIIEMIKKDELKTKEEVYQYLDKRAMEVQDEV